MGQKKASKVAAKAKKTAQKAVKKVSKKPVAKASSKTSKKAKPAKKTASPKASSSKTKSNAKSKSVKSKAVKAPVAKSKAMPAKSKTQPAKPKASAAKPKSSLVAKPNLISSAGLKTPGKIVPLDDRIVVKLTGADRTTPSGLLYIPDTVSDVSGNLKGSVLAIGRGHMTKKGRIQTMDVQVGDEVLFTENSGTRLKWNDADIVVLRESEVLGVARN